MLHKKSFASLVVASVLSACGTTPPASDPDSGPIVLDDSGPGGCVIPTADFGTQEGRNFRPFTLNQCDGTPFEFYGEAEGYCAASFTVLTMAAGWCGPCRLETEQLEEEITQGYANRGVRVVQAVIQDNDYAAPDAAFCEGWVAEYGLTNPVVLDPTQVTQIYFPAGSLPATLIVDSHGVIRHREYGTSTGLRTIRAALDELLASEGL
jgi:hypothetical protein